MSDIGDISVLGNSVYVDLGNFAMNTDGVSHPIYEDPLGGGAHNAISAPDMGLDYFYDALPAVGVTSVTPIMPVTPIVPTIPVVMPPMLPATLIPAITIIPATPAPAMTDQAAVPEPSTLLLFAVALILLAVYRFMRRKAVA